MLTANELTQLRNDVIETLPGTAVIKRAVTSVSDAGVPVQAFAAVGTVLCRVDPVPRSMDVRRGVLAEREATTTYFQLTVKWDADIVEGDQVVFASETLEITSLNDIQDDRIVKRAVVARIEGA